jgi:hypothetical protein
MKGKFKKHIILDIGEKEKNTPANDTYSMLLKQYSSFYNNKEFVTNCDYKVLIKTI